MASQRKIKFRAWGKNSKEFLQDSQGYELTLKEIQNIEDIDLWEFTQFTGLTDKLGKEIYEGDIITFYPNAPFVIGWDEKMGKLMYCYSNLKGAGGFTKTTSLRCKIIGNIYENSELFSLKR